ncbi:MAG: alanine--tRNA ligase [Candidatus Andersenbacteria bacterium]|nr:alanine--tRNA ligase [bacterium]MDZ4225837.1 alanine--tRNA ligase [Candidatus Andersenbacteria bacterium]
MSARISSNDLRTKYLDFFASKGHKVIASAPLVPENDPTTLFTGSGMQPMVPYLLGQRHPLGNRIVDVQKCFRAVDIDEIGDNRHTSFFEMLGNWSLGDYFKKEQIPWVLEFLTEVLGLNANQLYVTVFRGREDLNIPRDEVSADIWRDVFQKKRIDAKVVDWPEKDGLQGGRIFYYDETKNWWSRSGAPADMPVNELGGPDSEIFWDFGENLGLHEKSPWKDKPCHVNCDCGRFLEIGNSVFMEFIKTDKGFAGLPQKNIDFGGGLERVAAALNDNPDIFKIDLFADIIAYVQEKSGEIYGQDIELTNAFRVIADHARAVTFLIADGAVPANKDQGYFTRRLIRRAVRFGYTLGLEDRFLADIARIISRQYENVYPAIEKNIDVIAAEITNEENKFRKTLKSGLEKIEQYLQNTDNINGKQAFEMYATFGFPIEMLVEEAVERGCQVDIDGFKKELNKHRDLSRTASAGKFKGGLADHGEMTVKYHTATHLLHQSLRTVLGDQVEQRGSNITAERLRFDFSYPNKLNNDQLAGVETLVNEKIQDDLPVQKEEVTVAEAKEAGAIGLFAAKYGEKVSVYSIGDFSREICGGPHVERTGMLGRFKVIKEESAGAGVRRIKAVLKN